MFNLSFLFGGDPGIAQTVANIKKGIFYSLREPEQRIRRRAESLIRARAPEKNDLAEMRALYGFAMAHFHYVLDPRGLEYTKSPEVSDKEITDYNEFIGDCDDGTAYLAALLSAVGYPVRLVVMTDKRSPRDDFQHIYLQAYSRKNKQWIPMDVTARGKPFGWEAPAKRRRFYDVDV